MEKIKPNIWQPGLLFLLLLSPYGKNPAGKPGPVNVDKPGAIASIFKSGGITRIFAGRML